MVYCIDHGKSKDIDKSNPTSHTNYRLLTSPEKTARLKNLHDRIPLMHQSRTVRLGRQLKINGTEIENKALADIVEDKSPFIASFYEEGSCARIFWEVQQQASSLKNMSRDGRYYKFTYSVWYKLNN